VKTVPVYELDVERENSDRDILYLCGSCSESIGDYARVLKRRRPMRPLRNSRITSPQKGTPMITFERTYTNAAGQTVRARVEIREDDRMERAVRNLARKALGSKTQKCASALGGMVRVCIVEGKPTPRPSDEKHPTVTLAEASAPTQEPRP
jgi:hypothetical protein